jgi:sigma-B regulation protein RsbU (phosphoserine phosphatase)
MRLWKVQTLIVNAVVVLGFLIHGAYTAWEQTERERTEITLDVRTLAQSIAAGSADDILTASYDRIEGRLLRVARLISVRDLVITDPDGRVLSHVRRESDDSVQPVYGALYLPDWPTRSESIDGDRYTFVVAIERGQILGHVVVTAGLERLDAVQEHIWLDTLRVTLLTVLIVAGLQAVLLKRTGRELEATANFAEELVQHRGAQTPAASFITETRQLRSALNRVSIALARQHNSLSDSEALKGAILEAWMDCLVIVDEDGCVVEFNHAAEQTFGYRRDEAIGGSMADMIIPDRMRQAHSDGMRHYLATGEGPALRKRLEMPALGKNGEEFPVELTIVPFELHGRRFFLGAMRNLTAQKALEEDRRRTEHQLMSTLADLDARDRALDDHAIVSVTDLQGTIIYANRKFSEVSGYSNAELLGQNHRLLKSGKHESAFYEQLWRTISEGKTWHGEIANRRKDGSLYWVMSTIVPVLDASGLPRQYIAIRTDISEQKAAAEEVALARQRELAFGFQIQQTLLLGHMPKRFGSIDLAVHVEPSTGIDGDFYEFMPYEHGSFDLAIGDVMGKGVPAALIGAGVKQVLGKVSPTIQFAPMEPEQIVNDIHRRLFDDLLELERFVTFAYFRFEPERHRLTFVDAGHTKAILSCGAGSRFLEGPNLPLGVRDDEVYDQSTVEWHPGDAVLLYSDGLSEAMNGNGEMFGTARLSQLLAELNREQVPACVIAESVRAEIRDFLDGLLPGDDSTCIVIGFPVGGPAHGRLQLPWNPDELARMRAEIECIATGAGLADDAVQELVLAASETSANIMGHAPKPLPGANIHVTVLTRQEGVEVVFHYLGEAFDQSYDDPDFSGESQSGFGLYIVRNSVDEVSYEALSHGVFRIRLLKRRASRAPDDD